MSYRGVRVKREKSVIKKTTDEQWYETTNAAEEQEVNIVVRFHCFHN